VAGAKGFSNFSIRVKGAEQLARSLRRSGQELSDLRASGARAGELLVQRARVYCPVKTGRLQGSIHVFSVRGGVTIQASKGIVYGPVQHWGWPAHNIRATLFMTKALAETRSQVVRIYEEGVQDTMDKVTGA